MENNEPTRLNGVVPKGWGYELIWASTDKYCGKIMFFEKANAKFSMHFHKEKDETWFVNTGNLKYDGLILLMQRYMKRIKRRRCMA